MSENSVAELASVRISQWALEEKARQERSTPTTSPGRRIITISRQYGAGGHAIAELAAKRLGSAWAIWDKEIVDEVAKHAKVRSVLVSALDEHSLSRLEEILRYVSNRWEMSPESYYRHLVEVLLALSQQGDKIIIGRGANFVLKDALRVRLCASEHYRIQAIMARESLTEADASARIAHVEAERSRFVNSFYHRDVNDPSAYDLIVNVDRIGLEPAAASITAAMDAMCASAAAHEMPMRLGR